MVDATIIDHSYPILLHALHSGGVNVDLGRHLINMTHEPTLNAHD